MSAYACEPGKGSEPAAGWQWTLHLARFHDLTVVTRANNRQPIEQALARLEPPHPQFIYYDLPAWVLAWKKRGLPVQIYYTLWQAGVRLRLRKMLKDFDLIHHLTFNTFLLPGFWWFTGKPVILGPLGGGMICPWAFLPLFGPKAFQEVLRSLLVLGSLLNPAPQLSFHFASKILVANADTARRLLPPYRAKVGHMLETGIGKDWLAGPVADDGRTGDRLIWVGSLIERKAAVLALRALSRAARQRPSLRLTIVGDGRKMAALKNAARSLGVEQRITWMAKVPYEEVPSLLRRHDVFLFTSVRDTSGNVVLEAMAAGLPVITLCHQGAAEITTDETALRIRPTTIQRVVAGLADAMVRLAESPQLRRRLGDAGRARVADLYLWDRKAEQMNAIYREVLGEDET